MHIFLICVYILYFTARIEKNKYGKIVQVHLKPTIDVDPLSLATMRHLVDILRNLVQYKVVKVKLKYINMRELEDAEVKEIWGYVKYICNMKIMFILKKAKLDSTLSKMKG